MPPFLPHPHPLPSTSSSSSSSTSTTSSCLLLRPLPFALELDCPVPWPGTALDASNNLNPLESRTALPCTSVQLLPASDGSPGKGKERELLVAPNNPQISQPEDALQWIRRRYWECLWLSELHSPLSSFIPSISRLAHSKDPSQLYLSILPLLRGCNDINTRFRHLLSSLLPTLCRHASARHSHASVARVARDCTESHKDGIKLHEQLNKDEVGVITLALLDGPAAAVRREAERGQEHKSLVAQGPPHQNSTADQAIDIDEETERATMGLGKSAPVAPSKDTTKDLPGRLGRKWLDAIERREYQLQIVLLLFLLRLSAEHPPPAPSSPQTHSTCIASSNGISPPADRSTEEAEVERPKKRKRKIDKPRRYIGPGVQIEGADDSPGFPWDRRAVRETVAPHASPGWSNSEESGTEPEALNRRLEALMDRLCLKQVTASLSLDLDLSYSLASGSQGQEQTQDGSQGQSQAQIATAHEEAQLLFGSAGRPIDPHDEHDELQWFCADIVQPMFGSSLPHQCAAIRNKCFVPGVSTITPSRLANTHDREIERVAASRADTDLVARRAERVRAQKELKAARPALADVLRAETRSAQPGVAAAQRARAARAQERQVEMNRRFARSSSASSMVPPHLPQSPRPVLHATTSETVARLSKRKARSPQRRVTDPTNAGNAGPQTLVLATPTKPRAPFAQRPGISQYRFTVPELAFAPRTPATAFRRAESQPVGTIDAFWTDDGKGGDIDCIAGTRLPTSPVRVETRRKETQYPSNLGAQYSLASRVTTASHPASTETPSPARSTSDVEQTFVVEASPDRSSLQSMSDSRVRLASLSDQLRPGPAPLRPRNPFARSESQPAGRVAFGRSFGAQNSTAFGARAVLTRCERTPNSTRALDGSGEYTSGSDVEEDDIEHVVAGKRISSLQQADLRSARSPFATAATSALAAARAAPPRVASTVQPFVR